MNDEKKHELMTLVEVGAAFGMNAATIRTWIKGGKLAAIRTPGGQYRVRREVVDQILRGEQ